MNAEDRQDRLDTLGSTRLEGPAYNLAMRVDVELRVVFGSRGALQPHVRGVPLDGVLPGPGRRPGAKSGGGQGPGADSGSRHREPAGLHLLRLQGFSGNAGDGRPKWQNRGEYQVIDNLTWIKGKHILKFGGRMYHRNILFTDARSHNGAYHLQRRHDPAPGASAGTGDSFADFLLGYPRQRPTRSNPATWWGGNGTYWHGFFQDD